MKINYTNSANTSFEDEVDYIFAKWNRIEAEKFISLVEDFTNRLSENPYIGKKSVKRNIRVFVLSKQTTIVYKIKEELQEIDLIFFWNNKRNLKKFNKLIK